ncbi:hypothetical protein [Frigidibacter sp. ROC022]|uniref:hypothetical protein n=1 Tax=Frigidibacter sp. ROC022 TaxID=2971796 RepID=UPI00215AFED2|nr:hypothetical protein [Frigidibacter sp. ROC022]MCR8724175.1 hypothetical protein [Frigidibacter sp. ROC022]
MTFTLTILLPIAVLVGVAVLLPRWMQRITPETLAGLILNGLASAAVLTVLATLWFFGSYLYRGDVLLDLFEIAPGSTVLHFLRLGLASALIWGPVLVLAVAAVPKRWKEATW